METGRLARVIRGGLTLLRRIIMWASGLTFGFTVWFGIASKSSNYGLLIVCIVSGVIFLVTYVFER